MIMSFIYHKGTPTNFFLLFWSLDTCVKMIQLYKFPLIILHTENPINYNYGYIEM